MYQFSLHTVQSLQVSFRKFAIYCFIAGLLLAPTWWNPAVAQSISNDKEVLVIYGTGGLATWEQNFNLVFRAQLGAQLGVFVTPEFLSLINSDSVEKDLVARSLALKYGQRNIDLIVGLLPEANTFIRDYRHIFAPEADVLHILPANDVAMDYGDNTRVAILESSAPQAIVETMRLAPQILPNVDSLAVVGGSGLGDASYMTRYRQVLSSMELPYSINYYSGLPVDELLDSLRGLSANTAIVMTTYDSDNQGNLLRTLVVTETLATELGIPVLVMADTLVPAGALGGNVSTAEEYARTSASFVQELLANDFPQAPITAGTQFMFNGQQLDKFGVDRDVLPTGSIIINDHPSLWRQYGFWLVTGTAIIAAQLALIALLLQAIRLRKRAERELRQTQKLEALGSLAGGIAHDFNNILMSIIANAEVAEDKAHNLQLRSYLANILTASERAKNLVRQILMFSRTAAEKDVPAIDVCAHIRETVEQFRSFVPETCKISIECEDNLAAVCINPTQLHQLILNLCVNAQHAIENQGLISISAVSVSLEQARTLHSQIIPRGKYIVVHVTDTGCGIGADTLKHIFEPFYTTKPRGKGTGLGLALVYQIVKNHDAYIDLQSEVGLGTTFSLYFKAEAQDIKAMEPQSHTRAVQGSKERILLIDDDEMVLDVINRILGSLGYTVNAFTSSVSALHHFENHPDDYDLVFSDLSMPEMDGVRLLNKILQIRPGIPTILCTGYMDSLDADDLPNCQILNKPVRSAELSEAISNSLRTHMAVAS